MLLLALTAPLAHATPWTLEAAGLRGTFSGADTRIEDDSGGVLRLTTVACGRDGLASTGCTEWWIPTTDGLEQGWTLDAPPPGVGELVITVSAPRARVSPWVSGFGADLVAEDGSGWTISRPRAWDANGVDLPITLEGEGDALRVVVDDAGATWPVTVDPVVSSASATILGTDSGYLGQSLAGGDVNGDGYADLVVSAHRYAYAGVVYVYLGGPDGIGATPDASLYGATSGYDAFFGWALAVGDFDGDGYADIAASETYYNNGTVYVFRGEPTGVHPTASLTFSGASTREQLGFALAAGDYNGDGYDDLVAATPYREIYGAADVHYGSSSGLGATVATLTGGTFVYFGYSADSAGDVDGDGYDDVVLGDYRTNGYYGRAWVFTGAPAGLDTSRRSELDGMTVDVAFGSAVGGVGDLDGDGFDDVGVGASSFNVPYSRSGAAFIYYGAATGIATTPATTLYGAASEDTFGRALDAAGDVDGDGYGDLLVGAPYAYGGSYGAGAAHIFPGSPTGPDVAADQSFSAGTVAYEQFGAAVAGVGDVNGDGLDDVLIGQPEHTGDSSRSGAAYLYLATRDIDGDGLDAADDCDDGDPTVGGPTTSYPDADGDGYGAPDAGVASCTPLDGVTAGGDCDDTDVTVNPGAEELTGDGIDSDCSGGESCYADADGDGVRTDTTIASADADCLDAGEAAASVPGGDCDDADASIPGAEGVGDGVDGDCDGAELCYADADGDGARDTASVASMDTDCTDAGEAPVDAAPDCDDGDAATYPGAVELPGDEVDEDCDGAELCFVDADGDGARTDSLLDSADADCADPGEAPGFATPGDCDDADPATRPGIDEVIGDERDQDCDGVERCYTEADGDGFRTDADVASSNTACADPGQAPAGIPSGDCDDSDPDVHPGTAEAPGDGVDQDCDGAELCFVDADGDGYRPDATSTVPGDSLACDGAGEALGSDPVGDCDDSSAAVGPGVPEVCNGTDDDCDGLTDDTDPSLDLATATGWYADADGDGYTSPTDAVTACTAPDGYSTASADADCDDVSAAIHPGATETPDDGIDQDCDGADGASEVKTDGCGCATGSGRTGGWVGLLVGLAAMVWRRR